jgi:hypothetical protein
VADDKIKLTKKQIEEAIATMYSYRCDGLTDKETMDVMGLNADTYLYINTLMYEQQAEELKTKPREHSYIDYIIKQSENVKDLSKMIDEFKTSKQFGAMVGAVRARAEIYDKIIKTGQEFGIIEKTPERKEIMAGVAVVDMTSAKLKEMITTELKQLNVLMATHGDVDVLSLPPAELHHGPTLEEDMILAGMDTSLPTAIMLHDPNVKPRAIVLPRRIEPSKTVRANTSKIIRPRHATKQKIV